MANLSLRNLDDDTYRKLRVRAAEHGVSMEEEIRRILRRSVATSGKLGELAVECFGSEAGVDLELPPREISEPRDLSD